MDQMMEFVKGTIICTVQLVVIASVCESVILPTHHLYSHRCAHICHIYTCRSRKWSWTARHNREKTNKKQKLRTNSCVLISRAEHIMTPRERNLSELQTMHADCCAHSSDKPTQIWREKKIKAWHEDRTDNRFVVIIDDNFLVVVVVLILFCVSFLFVCVVCVVLCFFLFVNTHMNNLCKFIDENDCVLSRRRARIILAYWKIKPISSFKLLFFCLSLLHSLIHVSLVIILPRSLFSPLCFSIFSMTDVSWDSMLKIWFQSFP